jgi:hypothetical protein
MRRFLQHVQPRGFHKVRYFGLWHPAQRQNGARMRQMLQLQAPPKLDSPLEGVVAPIEPPGAQPMPPIARIHHLRWLLRGRSTEGDRHRAEGQEEVCLDRRLGLPGLAGGDPTKPLVTDPTKQCFECHQPKKNKDFVYSTTSCERSMDWLVRSSRTCGLCSGDLSAAVTSLYEVVSDPPLWVNC